VKRGANTCAAGWLACVALLACAHFPPNEPLERADRDHGYRVAATSGDADD
jgi:hypothetical protein